MSVVQAVKSERVSARLSREHIVGVCGGAAGLCARCEAAEFRIVSEWAARQDAPNVGEGLAEYWRRIGGPFLDSWYAVAWEQRKRSNLE